jgi:hypothetical protein
METDYMQPITEPRMKTFMKPDKPASTPEKAATQTKKKKSVPKSKAKKRIIRKKEN